MEFLISTAEQSLIFGLMALGVFLTYKILDFPDLTVEGTFPLGASIFSSLALAGLDQNIALLLAFLGGFLGGLSTGFLHTKMKISGLLSGILTMTALYSINLKIMTKPNLSLFQIENLWMNGSQKFLLLILTVIIVKLMIDWFLKTELGMLLRTCGDNEVLLTSMGIESSSIKLLGLGLSNGLVALAGAIMAGYQGFSDISMGGGILVGGLASIILGMSLFKSPLKATTASILGAFIYRGALAFIMTLGISPGDLKLATVLILIFTFLCKNLSSNNLVTNIQNFFKERGFSNDKNKKSIEEL